MLAMHFFGFVFMLIPQTAPLFISLTPLNLIISAFFLLLWHEDFDRKFIYFALSAFSIGFFVEWLGVHTGLIFGKYEYGKTLGFAIDGIPLMIGVNWFVLTYCSNQFAQNFVTKKYSPFAAAAIMTFLDVFIEPTAIRFDMWHWYGKMPPLQNYIAWFFVSLLISFLFQIWVSKQKNHFAMLLLAAQFLFFLGFYVYYSIC